MNCILSRPLLQQPSSPTFIETITEGVEVAVPELSPARGPDNPTAGALYWLGGLKEGDEITCFTFGDTTVVENSPSYGSELYVKFNEVATSRDSDAEGITANTNEESVTLVAGAGDSFLSILVENTFAGERGPGTPITGVNLQCDVAVRNVAVVLSYLVQLPCVLICVCSSSLLPLHLLLLLQQKHLLFSQMDCSCLFLISHQERRAFTGCLLMKQM